MIGGLADIIKWAAILNLVSGTGPVPPEFKPPGVVFTPQVNLTTGLTSAVPFTNGSKYWGNTAETGGIITVVNSFLIETDGSAGECKISLEPPLPSDFASTVNAGIVGLPSIVLYTGLTTPINTGSGWNGKLEANTATNGIDFYFECSLTNTQYKLDFTYTYVLL